MTVVRLYTPLSREAAARALAGEGFPDSVIFFVDSPHPDAAEEDTAWVAIELPESQVERFEDSAEVFRGYRKFTIPGRTAGRLPVFPVDQEDSADGGDVEGGRPSSRGGFRVL